MKSSEFVSYFPLYKRINEPGLVNSSKDVIAEYNFEEVKLYFYRIFQVIPSTQYYDLNMRDMPAILKFLKEDGFEFLLTHNVHTNNDESVTAFLINDKRKIILKYYWLNTDVQSYDRQEPSPETSDSEYDEYPPEMFRNSESYISNGEMDVLFAYIPTPENIEFLEKFRSVLTVENPEDAPDYVHIFEQDATTKKLKLSPYKIQAFEVDIAKHYNDDFEEVNERIIDWCGDFKKRNNRLVLLHGDPGNGKTNYMKYLMTKNKKVRKIYIPPYFVTAMTEPGFFNFIKNYANSVLIIEDAEKILLSRETDGENSAMSVILNLTDGILGDVLNFKIIASFNVDENRIDPALKRKGRLQLKYNFKNLSKEKTRNLYKELYNKEPDKDSMSLADIFNAEDNGNDKKEERKIGFGT